MNTGALSVVAAMVIAAGPVSAAPQEVAPGAGSTQQQGTATSPHDSITRDQVKRELLRAMSSGYWRCLTNERGRCSHRPVEDRSEVERSQDQPRVKP